MKSVGFLALALWSCAPAIPAKAATSVVSIGKLDCADCGVNLAKKLDEHDEIYSAKFDRRRAELTIVAAVGLDVYAEAKRLSQGEEFELAPGGGKGSYLAPAAAPTGVDVVTIAKDGQDVPDLRVHLVKDKVTVMEFGAAWCEPCRDLDKHMFALQQRRADIAYRKLDVGDWDTPLGARYLKDVPSLPYVIVWSKDGRRIDAISGLNLARLDRAIAGAAP